MALTSDAPPPKKKSKKNTSKDQQEPEWNWEQSRADWSSFIHSQYPPPPSLVAAYTSLKAALSSPNEDQHSYASRLTDVIRKAFETIYAVLVSVQQTQPPPIPLVQVEMGGLDSARIATVSPLLMYVLRTVLPALIRTTHENSKPKRPRLHAGSRYDAHTSINQAINNLLESILLPCVRSFVPLCNTRLAALLPATAKKAGVRDKAKGKGKEKPSGKAPSSDHSKLADARTDLLALLGASFAALDALPPYPGPCPNTDMAAGVRERLGLEAIRELDALYTGAPHRPSHLQAPSPSQFRSSQPTATETEKRAKRLERLAGAREERVRALAYQGSRLVPR
ncbi:hypothetical protein BU15DRAFT_74579 [Melanogaster broomeanus]|nr:hypothetical protein BU15DRAFT_74579 [Melanogaster broomeanus]